MGELGRDLWRRFRLKLVALTLLMVAAGATEGTGMLLFMPLIAVLTGAPVAGPMGSLSQQASVGQLALLVFLVFLCQGLLSIAQGKLVADIESDYVDGWRRRLLESILGARWSFFVERRTGSLLFAFGTETERIGRAFLLVTQIASTVVLLAIYLAIAIYLSWQFSLIILALGLAGFLLITRGFAREAYSTGASYAEHNSRLMAYAAEFFGSAKLVKATSSEGRVLALCAPLLSTLKRDYFGAVFYPYALKSILEFFIIAGLCLSLALSTRLGITFASMLILMAMFLRILPKLHTAQSSYQMLVGYLPSFQGLRQQLSEARAAAEEATVPSGPRPFTRPVRLELDRVSVAYGEVVALREVSLTVPEGSLCAIVGSSGAGKSTLVDLVVRIMPPSAGMMRVDGAPLDSVPVVHWRQSLGYVTQEPLLVHDTIRNNIAWGAPDCPEEEIQRASKLANAHEFILSLPDGYDTLIGERGARLSGGQKQRIVLARALVSRPVLLVLDEATSALDVESEQAIGETIACLRGEVTTLLVSHKLAPVRDADQIVLLDEGRVVELGTWEELMERRGRFHSLWNAQQTAFER